MSIQSRRRGRPISLLSSNTTSSSSSYAAPSVPALQREVSSRFVDTDTEMDEDNNEKFDFPSDDPNVSSIYPGTRASSSGSGSLGGGNNNHTGTNSSNTHNNHSNDNSWDAFPNNNNNSNTKTVSVADYRRRFEPQQQQQRRSINNHNKDIDEREMSPSQGALQFVPAFEGSVEEKKEPECSTSSSLFGGATNNNRGGTPATMSPTTTLGATSSSCSSSFSGIGIGGGGAGRVNDNDGEASPHQRCLHALASAATTAAGNDNEPSPPSEIKPRHNSSRNYGNSNNSNAAAGVGRISRLASLFSSRATTGSSSLSSAGKGSGDGCGGGGGGSANSSSGSHHHHHNSHDHGTVNTTLNTTTTSHGNSSYNNNNNNNNNNSGMVVGVTPPSPNPSSNSAASSGGYVGWPGTVDKRGATVQVLSSYDDSSAGGAPGSHIGSAASGSNHYHYRQHQQQQQQHHQGPGGSRSVSSSPSRPQSRKQQQQQQRQRQEQGPLGTADALQMAAEREMTRWTGVTSTNAAAAQLYSDPSVDADDDNYDDGGGFLMNTSVRSDIGGNSSGMVGTAAANSSSRTARTNKNPQQQQYQSSSRSVASGGAISFRDIFPDSNRPKSRRTGPPSDPWAASDADDLSNSHVAGSSMDMGDEDDDGFMLPPDVAPSGSSGSGSRKSVLSAVKRQLDFPSLDNEELQPMTASLNPPPPPPPPPPIQMPPEIRKIHQLDNNEGMMEHQEEENEFDKDGLMVQPTDPPPFHGKGYRGFIDKTKEVPSLMDAVDSDSTVASSVSRSIAATSIVSAAQMSLTRDVESANGGANNNYLNNSIDDGSDIFDGLSVSKESDVFDNLSCYESKASASPSPRKYHTKSSAVPASSSYHRSRWPERIAEEEELHQTTMPAGSGDSSSAEEFSVVLLPGGLAIVQTSEVNFNTRTTASDYDETLTNSDVDQYGFTTTPAYRDMLSAGTRMDNSLIGIDGNLGKKGGTKTTKDPPPPRQQQQQYHQRTQKRESPTSLSHGDLTSSGSEEDSLFTDPYDHSVSSGGGCDYLSEYYIPQQQMKKVLRRYRRLSDIIDTEHMTLEQFELEEDEHKAFALFEMRSRVMEKDIERGLERRGGTQATDDLVTTDYYKASHRIRDAVIVSKAWRDGASTSDVIKSHLLTRKHTGTYYIQRQDASGSSYFWEAVKWIDDTDFCLYRCPSLGPKQLRGFEMFTVGDCQSILLKLTNERCLELRRELNAATRRQIEAEDSMRVEGDSGENGFGMMTDAEMEYLTAMEEVKTVSKNLVNAEQSFTLVKDRIQKLVARYEHLLSKIETQSSFGAGASSVVTSSSSYSEGQDSEFFESKERALWARRAKRSEVKAELAAREALLAKQETQKIREEKQREIEALQQKLLELQSESSYAGSGLERDHSLTLAKNITMRRHDNPVIPDAAVSTPAAATPGSATGIGKNSIDDVKKRFRDRMAARKKNLHHHNQQQRYASSTPEKSSYAAGQQQRHEMSTTTPSSLAQQPRRVTLSPAASSSPSTPNAAAARDIYRTAGEEMYQQLDFYERSLKAVEISHL